MAEGKRMHELWHNEGCQERILEGVEEQICHRKIPECVESGMPYRKRIVTFLAPATDTMITITDTTMRKVYVVAEHASPAP